MMLSSFSINYNLVIVAANTAAAHCASSGWYHCLEKER